jgi:hypothetical protein
MQMRSNHRGTLLLKISAFLVLLAAMTGCYASAPLQTLGDRLSTPTEISPQELSIPGKAIVDYIPADSIADSTLRSTLIVIGQVEQDSRTINMARDVNDLSKPDLSILGLGQVYQVIVKTIVKGTDPGSTILIIQPEGLLVKAQASTEPSPEDAKLARQNYAYVPFVAGHRYLLFLHPLRGFEQQQYFTGGLDPWRFDATDENNVYPESSAPINNIRPAPLAEIIKQIGLEPVPTPTVMSPLPTPSPVVTAVPTTKAAP